MKFLDTNVFLRFLTRDDETKAEACLRLFQRLDAGLEEATTCEAILAEVVYVLSSRGSDYNLPAREIAARMRPLLSSRGLKLPNKKTYLRALDVYETYSPLDFEDALAIAHMERQKLETIMSYDRDFDRIAQVKREEP